MEYNGTAQSALQIKQEELNTYLQAEQAFAAGAQSYRIGNREISRMDPQKIHSIIDQLMTEIAMLKDGGQRQSFAVIPRDI